jgi:hypothetical protein
MATIDACVAKCTANRGDVIYVMPGHAETVAAASGINLDVAGISVIGLGNGTNRPLLSFSVITSTMNIGAANVTVANMQFSSAVNNLAAFIDVNAVGFTLEDCLLYTASALEAYTFINLVTTCADDVIIRRCEFRQPTDPNGTAAAAGTGCIFFVDSENILVEDCRFIGNFETAIFHNRTTAAANVWIKNCVGRNALSDGLTLVLVATATGWMTGSTFVVDASADIAEANVVGTESADFFYSVETGFGNDGSGGQRAGQMTVAS